jgi:hypothetical protein
MKYKGIAIVILSVYCAAAASAQEEIGGAGTPNFVARFTGKYKIGNSNIFQSPSGNIGIGTTNPLNPLQFAADFHGNISQLAKIAN